MSGIVNLFRGFISDADLLAASSMSDRKGLLTMKPAKLERPEIIGGQEALINYTAVAPDEEVNLIEQNMKLARNMAARGASFEDQVARTGMGIGPDGKLRFEIPDTGAKLTIPTDMLEEGEVYKAKDLLSHPRLYNFYPDLAEKEIRIVNEPDKPQSFGAYNFNSQVIDLNIGSQPFIDKSPVQVVSGLLHEAQHYAQQIERFIRGTSRDKELKKYTNKKWFDASEQDRQKATADYLKNYGEAEARNVQLRFEDPIWAKFGPQKSTTKGKTFPQTMGQDPFTVEQFKRPLGPTEFINQAGESVDSRLEYTDPFGDTTREI
jgi:hypothetical protein